MKIKGKNEINMLWYHLSVEIYVFPLFLVRDETLHCFMNLNANSLHLLIGHWNLAQVQKESLKWHDQRLNVLKAYKSVI